MKAKLIQISGNKLTFELDDNVYLPTLERDARGYINATITFDDSRFISADQRKHIFALCKDYAQFVGYMQRDIVEYYLFNFAELAGLNDMPSLAAEKMSRETASDLIDFIITDMIQNEIPFSEEQWYLTRENSKFLFALTMKRQCWLCGKFNSDIAHVEAVGMGRKRDKVDHTKHHIMCLCREHHNLQHTMGIESFCELHVVKPIKLNIDQMKGLGVM